MVRGLNWQIRKSFAAGAKKAKAAFHQMNAARNETVALITSGPVHPWVQTAAIRLLSRHCVAAVPELFLECLQLVS
jgi:hypothetical protein